VGDLGNPGQVSDILLYFIKRMSLINIFTPKI